MYVVICMHAFVPCFNQFSLIFYQYVNYLILLLCYYYYSAGLTIYYND